jgi:hypothetical protein
MKRRELPPNKTASFVLPRWKVVYISVPKAGCTSLKWLMAELQDEPTEHFSKVLSAETSRSMLIHHRAQWQHTPMLRRLSDEELESIRPDNGWFIFGVVRHPSARLWSGWQSKWLLREPRFRRLFPDHETWPRIPNTTADVVEDFSSFVRRLDTNPSDPIFADRHFRAQTHLLRDSVTPYSRIYRTSEMGELMTDLEKHLLPLGLESMPTLRRSNETPLPPLRSLFSPDVLDTIGRHYGSDFERYGYDEVLPPGLGSAAEYSEAALAEVGRLVERSERILDLYAIGLQARRGQRRAQKRAERVTARARQRRPEPVAAKPFHRRALAGLRRRTARLLHRS